MFGELKKVSDDELLNFTALVLSRPRPLTSFDRSELAQITREWRTRGAGQTLPAVDVLEEL